MYNHNAYLLVFQNQDGVNDVIILFQFCEKEI